MKYNIAGRPPKDPMIKIGRPVRCLVSPVVESALLEAMEITGLSAKTEGQVSSDILRLAIYRYFLSTKHMTPELESDPTWDGLKAKGLV